MNGKVESTLTVTKAVLRHKGRYQCNINHKNAHFLNVHPSAQTFQSSKDFEADEKKTYFDSENDHQDLRERFQKPTVENKAFAPHEKIIKTFTTPSSSQNYIESFPLFDDEKSHEKIEDESTTIYNYYSDSSENPQTSTTIKMSTNISLYNVSLFNTTHATFHLTKPSEVTFTQIHLEKHHSKGSQK